MKNTLVVLCVVPDESERKFLLVKERDGTFYLPAGRVEAGESLVAAAIRETREEAGVAVEVRGLIGFDHDWRGDAGRVRFCFECSVVPPCVPKRVADEHTLGAAFYDEDLIMTLPLRDPEVVEWIEQFHCRPRLPIGAYRWDGPDSGRIRGG